MEVLKISKSLYVPMNRVIACLEKHSRNSEGIIKMAKAENRWIDGTCGKATKSIIIMDDNSIISSPFGIDTMYLRMVNEKETKEQK